MDKSEYLKIVNFPIAEDITKLKKRKKKEKNRYGEIFQACTKKDKIYIQSAFALVKTRSTGLSWRIQ